MIRNLDGCNAYDIMEDLGEEMDLMEDAVASAWQCWLHPRAYQMIKDTAREDKHSWLYEEAGNEYVKVFDNENNGFIIHMRIAGLDDSLGGLGNRRELDPDHPLPKAQVESLRITSLGDDYVISDEETYRTLLQIEVASEGEPIGRGDNIQLTEEDERILSEVYRDADPNAGMSARWDDAQFTIVGFEPLTPEEQARADAFVEEEDEGDSGANSR